MNPIKAQIKKQAQHGIALMMTMLMSVFILILITVSSSVLSSSEKSNVKRFTKQGQADNIARAGLQEAVNWFKTQSVQPVRQGGTSPAYPCKDEAFHPVYDADPLLRETIDESYGLVKDVQIDRSIWGRYRVKRQVGCTPSDYDMHAVHDFTEKRGKNESVSTGEGIVWYLESEGIVYRRTNYDKNGDGVFTTGPTDSGGENPILQTSRAAVEINRMAILVDRAAVTTLGSTASSFNSRCQVIGDASALSGVNFYGSSPNLPNGDGSISVPTGVPKTALNPNPTLTPERVFSVSKSELKSLSDNIYTDLASIPDKIPLSITYLDGNGSGTFSFDFDKPLVGGGILFVDGNVNLEDGSNSLFSGVVYITGTLNVGVNNTLSGAVIANRVVCNPGTGGTSSISYTHNYINDIRQILGTYRENSMSYKTANQ